VRVEFTPVRVAITFVRVEIIIRVEITITLERVEIKFVSIIFTRIRVKLTLVCVEHTMRVKSHSAGGNCTLQVEITFVRVEITLVRVAIADIFFC
jgi:hypothetical protein